uniref:SKP1 component POZ domain-containing protein n=1 Tax=Glossina brevipalpis TaxID=37001 RepID=A0A1A9W5U9_9MUSC
MRKIKLQSSEGESFDVDVNIAKCSHTIKTMLEDCGMEDCENVVVPLLNVNSATLRKVIEWAEYHKDDIQPAEEEERIDHISPWDADFLNMDQVALFELILAANYLDITNLFDISCKAVANMMKGKPAKEIRRIFNIKNDFTPAEEEQIPTAVVFAFLGFEIVVLFTFGLVAIDLTAALVGLAFIVPTFLYYIMRMHVLKSL